MKNSYPESEIPARNFRRISDEAIAEQIEQLRKWGYRQNQDDGIWLAVLVEEVGEVANAICDGGGTLEGVLNMRAELIQVAAVAMSWVDVIDHKLKETT